MVVDRLFWSWFIGFVWRTLTQVVPPYPTLTTVEAAGWTEAGPNPGAVDVAWAGGGILLSASTQLSFK